MHYPGEPAPGPFERFFKAARIGHGEFSVRGWFIADLVGFVVVTALVFWDQVIGLIPGVDEFSFLNPALWPWWIGVALVISALHVAVTGWLVIAGDGRCVPRSRTLCSLFPWLLDSYGSASPTN